MKLKNELTNDKGASFALAWAFTWRLLLAFVLLSIPEYFLRKYVSYEYSTLLAIVELVIFVLLVWLVIHHILRKGFARIKIVIMEDKHYKELVERCQDE